MILDVEQELSKAVKHFWFIRSKQKENQGSNGSEKDAGNRGAVTGGKHADGFVALIAKVMEDAGVPGLNIHILNKRKRTLPGFFRPSKEWDVLVLSGKTLVAVIEVKSQVGSFGNNFNNRVEEALGNATDFWEAYAEGLFEGSGRPWLGYLFMLEEDKGSMVKTKHVDLSPFKVDPAFQGLSYAERYEEVCKRLVRKRLYDAACFFTSNKVDGLDGKYRQPSDELSVNKFAAALYARGLAVSKFMP